MQVQMEYVNMKKNQRIVEVVNVKMDNSIQMRIVINIKLVVLVMEKHALIAYKVVLVSKEIKVLVQDISVWMDNVKEQMILNSNVKFKIVFQTAIANTKQMNNARKYKSNAKQMEWDVFTN